jgi:hypothetical protein
LKEKVSSQLKKLTVHIPNDENYKTTLEQLNKANLDFTEVDTVNKIIIKNELPKTNIAKKNNLNLIFYLIIINSCIPYLFWKRQKQKIKEKEFIDTMRFGVNTILFPFFYFLQAIIISWFFNFKIGVLYFFLSISIVFIYTKLSPIQTED